MFKYSLSITVSFVNICAYKCEMFNKNINKKTLELI